EAPGTGEETAANMEGTEGESKPGDVKTEPEVITMDAKSVADGPQVSEEIKNMLSNMHTDPYSEDEAELRFLHSKPSCFIILGKPGVGKTTLARRFAQEWKCELINSTDLILQNMELRTEVGERCNEILTRGEAVPEEVVIKLIQEKLESPEVAHHGYVLDDFPCMSEATMTIEDQVELVKSWKLKPDFIINLKIPDSDLEKRRLGQKLDPEEEGPGELPVEVLERLIKRPEDMSPQAENQIAMYKDKMLRILEDYMADHNQQYLVEMDANNTSTILFKQLLQMLNCFVIRPAACPLRLQDAEEEEIPEEIETDELMRTLAPKLMVAPRFRWRRSRWLRLCPVALHEGNKVPGKPEFAVSFLDKIYCLSSPDALQKFMKNPRPYLLPPQPRPPCKLSVIGAPLSGKTTLCHLLAQKYGAKVLQVEEIIKPRMAEEKLKYIQQVRQESTEASIQAVKTKIKEKMEAEAAAAEEAKEETPETATEGEPKEEPTEQPAEEPKPEEPTPETEPPAEEKPAPPPEPEVDENHPEVIALVEAAVKEAEKQAITLPAEVIVEVMDAAVVEAERNIRNEFPEGPVKGGWIFDNFPNTRDQWNACVDKGLLPDDVIVLNDNSENGKFLATRYYMMNKDTIDASIQERLRLEEEEKKRKEEEKRQRELEEKRKEEEEARLAREEERRRRIEEGEEIPEEEAEGEAADKEAAEDASPREPEEKEEEKEPEETKADEEDKPDAETATEPAPALEREASKQSEGPEDTTASEPADEGEGEEVTEVKEEIKLPEGPEMEAFHRMRQEFEKEFNNVTATITGSTSIEPVTIDLEGKRVEELLEETVKSIEKCLTYQGWEYSGVDEEDPNRSKKKPLGDTNHFCPVALKETGVLFPGNPETAARYREKVYYLSSPEARDKFLANPESYLPKNKPLKPPPLRLLILGPRGSGKTTHGRHLAEKLGLFHIAFKERLQELIIHKTKKKIGPEFEEDQEEEEEPDICTRDKRGGTSTREEEPEVEYTEEEEAIKTSLENNDSLAPEFLENIVAQWWQKEPFKSTGFVLEGFPRTADEARYLSEAGLFPDAALIMTVSDGDVIGRLLPPKLDKWRVKRDKRLAKKARKKEKAKKKRDAAMQKRREELIKERDQRRAERAAERALRSLRLESVQETLEEILIPKLDIDAGRKPHIVRYILNKKLRPYVEFRHSTFERVYTISEKLAHKMIQTGYKQPSRFGRWCPVKLHEGDCIQPMNGPGYPSFPCIYRQHMYFLSSSAAKDTFTNDPMTYLLQESPKPVVPIRIAIVGPPKSGKTTLANRFVEEYGVWRLSVGEAMRHVLTNQPQSELARNMNRCLLRGMVVTEELQTMALEVCMLDMRCQTRGYVLDGYPMTKRQVELMTERNIIPVRVINLELDSKEVLVRGVKDRLAPTRTLPLHDSAQILQMKIVAFKKHSPDILQWYNEQHMNVVPMNASESKWWVWDRTLEASNAAIKQIQTYLQRIEQGKAASVADMCITPTEFVQRIGDYGQYCPVSLALREELVDCSTTRSLKYAAEFRGHYYKMKGQKELDQFLAEPEKYVPPLAPHKLPEPALLPRRRMHEPGQKLPAVELQGYCPVTFLDGKCRYEAIVPGNDEFIAEYREKFYRMETEEKLLKLMSLPEKYWNLKLPHKLPPVKAPLQETSLPMLGYMEQGVATALIASLTAAGNFKPKYPFLSSTRSALLYVAYHLKAFNPKSSDYVRKKYKQKLQKFEETCNLIRYLGNNMTVRYRDPNERPADFDSKLEVFFALKGIEPTPTWIA
ncbi:hypothetical protein BaRGS_00008622, partial [Batillaria attramentaria]